MGEPLRRALRWLAVHRGRPFGLVVLCALLALHALSDTRVERALRLGVFDSYQRLLVRERINDSVVIVEIDDRSLAAIGQWPWPRSLVAELIEKIAAQQPAALAVDIVFPEADRLSPRTLGRQFSVAGLSAAELAELPDSDEQLGEAFASLPAILGVGATQENPGQSGQIPYRPILRQTGGDAELHVPRFAASVRSIDVIDRRAVGHGAMNSVPEDGIVRRVPTLLKIGDSVQAGLALETLRVVAGSAIVDVKSGPGGIETVGIGPWQIPTDADGGWWLHYSDWNQRPSVSAADVLSGKLPPELLSGRVVLLGYTALGLLDSITTAMGVMPGVEVHAEAIENVLDERLLQRPYWALLAELAVLLMLGLLLIWAVPRLASTAAVAVFLGLAVTVGVLGVLAYAEGLLLDAANPLAGAAIIFGFMLSVTLADTQAQRRRLQLELMRSLEARARLEGELDAARRIQMGMLPRSEEVFQNDERVTVAARIQPARSVGGDLYDFFMLDHAHLFFQIGDVSGKGLPASLFMALAKALTKGAAYRAEADPGRALSAAARDIAGDNPEQLFVTVLAGVLNLDTGELSLCSAGHDAPLLLRRGQEYAQKLGSTGGPPLCVLDGFPYPTEKMQLRGGDILCLTTDGVTEAQNHRKEFYGAQRLQNCLDTRQPEASVHEIATAIEKDVARFVDGAEAADDITILVLRWNGSL